MIRLLIFTITAVNTNEAVNFCSIPLRKFDTPDMKPFFARSVACDHRSITWFAADAVELGLVKLFSPCHLYYDKLRKNLID